MAVSLGMLLWVLLQARWGTGISYGEITSVQALMLLCLWSMALMAQPKSAILGPVLGVTVTLAMGMGVGDWMVAQSDAQTAFDIRAPVMQIMMVSVSIGVLVYSNLSLVGAFRRNPTA